MLIYIIAIGFLIRFRKKGLKRNFIFYMFFTFMYVYLNVVVKYTQFPIYNDAFQKSVLGPFSIEKNFNFVPFKTGFDASSFYPGFFFSPLHDIITGRPILVPQSRSAEGFYCIAGSIEQFF